jgi:hypothetical protein
MEIIFFLVLFVVCFYLLAKTISGSRNTDSDRSFPSSEFKDDERLVHVRTIRTKIRGVTKRNADGTDRQRIIERRCHIGDALYLRREPSNPVDRCAIQVRRVVCSDVPDNPRLAEHLGYLSRELAQELAPRIDGQGHILIGEIIEVTGGDNTHSFGVNIQIKEYKPGKSANREG